MRQNHFTYDDIQTLYTQHTEETGQRFAEDVIDLVWELTGGQPWLVNALGDEVCFRMTSGRDRAALITAEVVQQAKENLVGRHEGSVAIFI